MGCRQAFSRYWLALAVAALCVGAACPSTAFAADTVEQTDRAEVFRQLGVDDVAADYVVVVDTSKSMLQEDRYARVKSALASFVGALSPNDRLTIITFDGIPTVVFAGKVGSNPNTAVEALPAKPPGNNTDIGSGLRAGIDELTRPGGADVAALVILTDGVHDPAKGSDFPQKSGPAWDELRAKAASLSASRRLRVYPMALTSGTDVGLVINVFPGATSLSLSQGQLESYFQDVKEAVRYDKASLMLAADESGAVTVVWPEESLGRVDLAAGKSEFDVTLTSTMTRIPLVVEDLAVTSSGDFPINFSIDPGSVTLAPGASARIHVSATWVPPQGFYFGKRQLTMSDELQMTGTIQSPWSQVIVKDLGLTLPASIAAVPAELTAAGEIGTSVWFLAALAVAALLVSLVIWAIVGPDTPARLSGTYRVGGLSDAAAGSSSQERSLTDDARRGAVLWFGGAQGEQPRVQLPGVSGDAFKLEARRSRRRGPVEVWGFAEGAVVKVKLPEDKAAARFVDGRVPPGSVIVIGSNEIRL